MNLDLRARAQNPCEDLAGYFREDRTEDDSALSAYTFQLVIDAVRARASVGEISDTLAGAWGRYASR